MLDGATLDRHEGYPTAMRKAQHRNAGGIDERLAHQKVQGTVGVEG